MPASKCAAQLSANSNGAVTPEEADQLIKELTNRMRRKGSSSSGENLAEALMKSAKEVAEELTAEAAFQKRIRALSIKKYKELSAKVSPAKNKFEALKGLLVTTPVYGNSVAAKQAVLAIDFRKKLVLDLKEQNLDVAYNSGRYDRDIAIELSELNQTPDRARPGRTGNKEAQKIAGIVKENLDRVIDRQNKSGAWIRKLPGYIARTSHDQDRIARAGFDEWYKFITEEADLDIELTLKNVEKGKEKQFFKSVWSALANGKHFKHGNTQLDLNQAFKASSSLAKKLSQERLLHFKSAEGWLDYNDRFGTRNLREAVDAQMEFAAEGIGLMEQLGPNPEAMFARLKEDALKGLRDEIDAGSKTAAAQFDKIEGRTAFSDELSHAMAQVDGTTRHVGGSLTFAKVGTWSRFSQTLAKLGGSTISAFSDIPLIMSELKFQGINILDSYNVEILRLLKGKSFKEQKEVASLLLAGTEGLLGAMRSRFSPDGPAGAMAKAQHLFFRLNLQTPWNDFWKNAATSIMSANIANKSALSWANLDPDLKRTLVKFDIEAKDWDVIRQLNHKTKEGMNLSIPEKINDFTPEQLSSILGEELTEAKARAYKQSLKDKMDAYYYERAETAIPTPGDAETAMMLRGTQKGTIEGELARWFGQFKSFPLTVISKVYGRETIGRVPGGVENVGARGFIEGLKDGKGATAGIVQLMIGTTIAGYLSMQAKEILKGRQPRPITDAKSAAKVMTAAFVQGGGAGIYGDFLFGEYSRTGNSLLGTLAGPVLGQLDDVAQIYSQVKDGDTNAANGIFRFFKKNTPFVNLFYTRAALDYMLFYQLQEMMNPGYLRRMEQRIKRDNDQEFIFSPRRDSTLLGAKP